ncbi:MAG TPA: class I SAM-dependent methyltransferase [Spirochaetota bacterium]|nr:class I SAM-dependent methyltransferase [Spirochaetota bacterium]HPG52241.1 class I SAM-dependent methyltransferase [Spirochaetota bacterium]HPN14094.1 class I SAM-dependent methyltransferase [Spirochaetota bacterium]HQL82995.1 class I SAM-dependent methyltransferase [Spirochaetota bacterium]
MYHELVNINSRPKPFEYYSAPELWTDDYTSQKMLAYHLNEHVDISSRNHQFIESSSQWIIDHFRLNDTSKLLDLGCGPGLYATRFARHGIKVTGIDFSPRSIEYARQSAARDIIPVEYINTNYLEYEITGTYDLIIMIMCDFCALSPAQRKGMLAKCKKALLPGASILLDVYSLQAYNSINEKAIYEFNQFEKFWSPHDYYAFVNTFKYDTEKVILDKYTIIEESRIRTIYNWLQYYDLNSLKNEFEENGLKLIEKYSNVSGAEFKNDSQEFAIVAVRN